MKINKSNNKTKKKRGGHIYYYEDYIGEKCRLGFLGMHQNDCWPTTLYLLGFLTRNMAERFALDTNYVTAEGGTTSESIIAWLNEALQEEHTYDVLFDSGNTSFFTNAWFMTYLNFLMPYRYLGMPITFEVYNNHGRPLFGHAYCIIRNGANAFRILDAQNGINIPLRHLNDLLSTVPPRGTTYDGGEVVAGVRIYCFMQSRLNQEWHNRTDNGNYTVSPFHPNFYGIANNGVRERMMYNKLENNYENNQMSNEENAGNNEDHYENNYGNNQGNNEENNEGNYGNNAGNNEENAGNNEWYNGYNNDYNEENNNVNNGGWYNDEWENNEL